MRIKTSKAIICNACILYFCVIAASAILLYLDAPFAAVFLFAFGNTITTQYWVALGRTFEFDSNGMTVLFFSYKRKIPWECLKLIRFFDSKDSIGYKLPKTRGVEFSPKALSRPHWLHPAVFCLIHPFTYCFVLFPGYESGKLFSKTFGNEDSDIYQVEAEIFISALHDWGIEPEL
mgnify:FL=1